MAQRIEDLVQNIITKCDVSGFTKLTRKQKEAIEHNKRLQIQFNALNRSQLKNVTVNKQLQNQMSLNTKEALAQIRINKAQAKANFELEVAERRRTLALEKLDLQQKRVLTNSKKTNALWGLMSKATLAVFGITTAVQMLKDARNSIRELDLMQRSIQGLTKSPQDFEFIKGEAFRTGTDISAVAKGYKNFYSSASMAGFGKGQIQSMYGDVLTSTRAMGASPVQTYGALLALDQMMSKGTVSMEELKRQLGNALPGAFEVGARAMNMTTAAFNDFVKKGLLPANEFVPKFIAQYKKEMGGGFNQAMKSLDASMNNLHTSWQLFMLDIGSQGFTDGVVKLLDVFTSILKNKSFIGVMRQLGAIIGFVFKLVSSIILFILESKNPIMNFLRGGGGVLFTVIAISVVLGNIMSAVKWLWVTGVPNLAKAIVSFKSVALPELMAVVAILLIAQDLIYGIFLRSKGFKSITGDILDKYKQPELEPKSTTKAIGKTTMPLLYLPFKGVQDMYNATFNKSNNKTTNSNLTFNINGSNNPQETADAIKTVLEDVGLIV